ncbi:MAG TPA: VTT domain-containing protein, partial [Chitinophagaceae bacterium]|nr:VTT domain-containing protein [Chitinophagaceae bacterium]
MYISLLFLLDSVNFTNFIERFGYIGIFLWFISFDQLTPIPEEISLLVIGYLSANNVFNPVLAVFFSLLGCLTIDTIYFILSRQGNKFIKKKTKGSSSLMASYREKIKQHTVQAFLLLCFIPRMRLFAPILAASMKFSFKKFLLLDGLALILLTSIFVSLGVIFHKSLSAMEMKVKGLQDIIFFASLLLATVVIIIFIIRRRKNKTRDQDGRKNQP